MSTKILKEWTTREGLNAKAVLYEMGFINGYVEAPDTIVHKEYEDLNINVHGGLTFKGHLSNDDRIYFGFDSAHYGDKNNLELSLEEGLLNKEEYNTYKTELKSMFNIEGTFRDLKYIVNECDNLSVQLKDLK